MQRGMLLRKAFELPVITLEVKAGPETGIATELSFFQLEYIYRLVFLLSCLEFAFLNLEADAESVLVFYYCEKPEIGVCILNENALFKSRCLWRRRSSAVIAALNHIAF